MANKRIMIAGTGSGCGKTTVACGLLAALTARGCRTASMKCGPDYIDPMFHRVVLGTAGGNLDPFFCGRELMRGLLAEQMERAELTLIEGAMGYYDGIFSEEYQPLGIACSSYAAASATDTPVVLVVDAKGASASAAAVIGGFLDFMPDANIAGVILNRTSEKNFCHIKAICSERFGERLEMLGYLPPLPEDCRFGSRHLGLITAAEIAGIKEKLARIGALLAETVDLERLEQIAGLAPPIADSLPALPQGKPFRLAIARDAAFCFYYEDNFRLLEKLGATLCFFSPLAGEEVPADAQGLWLGGGYPELYLDALAAQEKALRSIKQAASKLPTIAECGGFMLLGQKMAGKALCGLLPGESRDTGRLCRFGYLTLKTEKPGLFGPAGTQLKAHEFHYWDSSENGADLAAKKTDGSQYRCGFYSEKLYAGFPHLYLYSNPAAAATFAQLCH